MYSAADIDLYERCVYPVYGHLMGHTKIYNLSEMEQNNFIEEFIRIRKETDDVILKKMLFDSNWRCSLVGAWLIFSKNKGNFTNWIGQFLLQGKAGVVGYCYALNKFATLGGAQFLIDYLRKELQFDRFPQEKFQDFAYISLLNIDRKNGQNNIQEIQILWDRFVNTEYSKSGSKLIDSEKWGNVEGRSLEFEKMYNFIDNI
ncbi:hypothetical protein GO730_19770 [Spirosoma sp. HMF3257]|uniref:Uncharacterized protein n=1 Tax=Spirosoma telluris TaxID=2183553 RepID=A0A327NSV9_9BACT|nr:hypothetical protein [Spirosoma telluris]RAI75828.1 hypothetical protein HMF3257_19700 [Spirosoma telluris]